MTQKTPETQNARAETIIASLYRAHSLSKAIGFMAAGDIDDGTIGCGTFKASLEEVNGLLHEAVCTALDAAERLSTRLGKGGAA